MNMKNKILYLSAILLIIAATATYADTKKGGEIAKKFFDLAQPESTYAENSLVIIDSKNNKRSRAIKQYMRTVPKGEETYVEFLQPADVRGTKFLTYSYTEKNDVQRLFLPALGKSRVIASSEKGNSFMGTDFTYYDLEKHSFDDFTYNFIEDTKVNGIEVSSVELVPKDKNAPYSKQVVFYRKDNDFPLKTDCYGKDGKLIKSILYLKTEVQDGVIVPIRIAVDNKRDNQKTLLQSNKIVVNKPVPAQIFSLQYLEKK